MAKVSRPVEEEERRKLSQLDRDLNELYEVCRQSGLSADEMRRELEPLISAVRWATYKQTLRAALKLALAVFIIYVFILGLSSVQPIREVVYLYTRLAFIRMLPYWDWQNSTHRTCLLINPLYTGDDREITDDNCNVCETADGVDRITNLSRVAAMEEYINTDQPVIVTDAMGDWPVTKKTDFNRFDLLQLLVDDVMEGKPSCQLKTNLRARNDMRVLFDKMSTIEVKKWYAQWENCRKGAAKAIRTLYRRPYFLPVVIENTDSNWILLSSNYTGRVYKELPMTGDVTWLAQVHGTTVLQFIPRGVCSEYCPELVETLLPGEIAMFSDYIWDVSYLPGHGTDNLVIGVVGYLE